MPTDPSEIDGWENYHEAGTLRFIAKELFEVTLELQRANGFLERIANPSTGKQATHIVVTIKQGENVSPVAADIIIDTDGNAVVSGTWTDVMEQPAAAPANAGPLVYGSDTPATATVDPSTGKVTPVALGTFSGTIAAPLDTAGAPLLEADNVTAFPAPAPSAVATVVAGAATGLAVQVTG